MSQHRAAARPGLPPKREGLRGRPPRGRRSRARVVPLTGDPSGGARGESAGTGGQPGGGGRRGGGGRTAHGNARRGRDRRAARGSGRGGRRFGDPSLPRPRQAVERLLDAEEGRDGEHDHHERGDAQGRRPRRQDDAREDDDRQVPEVQRVGHVADGDGRGVRQHEEVAVPWVSRHPAGDHQRRSDHGQHRPGSGKGTRRIHHEERRDDDAHADPGGRTADHRRDPRQQPCARREHRPHGELSPACEGGEVRQRRVDGGQHHRSGPGCHDHRECEESDRHTRTPSAPCRCGEEGHRQQHEERPGEGVLLFDRQRPEVLQRRDVAGGEVVATLETEAPVRHQSRGRQPVADGAIGAGGGEQREGDRHDRAQDERGRGNQALDPPAEERREPHRPLGAQIGEEDAREEEPREDEEHIDADESSSGPAREMGGDDGEHGHRPQPLQVAAHARDTNGHGDPFRPRQTAGASLVEALPYPWRRASDAQHLSRSRASPENGDIAVLR